MLLQDNVYGDDQRVLVVDHSTYLQPWVSMNGSPLPDPIPLYKPETYRAARPGWVTDVSFWCAFVPRDLNFKERLFESLKIEKIEIKSQQYASSNGKSSVRYRLVNEVRLKWVQLEVMLGQLRSLLEHTIGTLPLELCFPPAPSDYRYDDFHPDSKRAYSQAKNARWAFILQMSYLSCLGRLFPRLVDPINLTDSIWSRLPDETKLALESCWIFDSMANVPRVGALIDTSENCQ